VVEPARDQRDLQDPPIVEARCTQPFVTETIVAIIS
jgi:hypothetical protein